MKIDELNGRTTHFVNKRGIVKVKGKKKKRWGGGLDRGRVVGRQGHDVSKNLKHGEKKKS